MIRVIDREGAEHELETLDGWRVMEIIRDHGLPIKAECGGACSCATCHVYVDKAWLGKIQPVQEMEKTMLDFAEGVEANSRLSCQIQVTEALDGMTVRMPKSQH